MKFWILISTVSVLDILGMILGKQYSNTHKPIFFLAAIICAGVMGALLISALQYKELAIVNLIWAGFTAILLTGAGYAFFHEHLTPVQFLGMGVVIGGLALMNK